MIVTRVLVAINFLVFIWEIFVAGPSMLSLMGGSGLGIVLQAGALSPNSVLIYHEWWRILTSAFLHAGLLHIGVNMISLWSLGRFIELVGGKWRMAVIYFVSLIASGLGVVYLSPPAQAAAGTLGASGAIFGLFGALFAIGFKLGPPGMRLVRDNIGILIVNLVITFTVPQISWQAHLSGLLVGFLLMLLIYYPPKRVAPVVVDAVTGDEYETEYQTPKTPHQ
jgi:membrane associated rhomboid family serine protease